MRVSAVAVLSLAAQVVRHAEMVEEARHQLSPHEEMTASDQLARAPPRDEQLVWREPPRYLQLLHDAWCAALLVQLVSMVLNAEIDDCCGLVG